MEFFQAIMYALVIPTGFIVGIIVLAWLAAILS